MKGPRVGDAEVEASIRDLARLDRHDLAERWAALYGAAPPARASRPLLLRAVAYKLQEAVYGGLSPATRRMLLSQQDVPKARPQALRSGTVLLREWQGVTHQVTVTDGGVLYRGTRHRSLSEVARLITGARWSGPAFFGLKGKPRS